MPAFFVSRPQIIAIIAAFVFITLFLATCFEVALVPTASMEGTVLIGDHLFVSKVLDGPTIPGTSWRLPRLSRIKREQIVSFRAPGRPSEVFLKRVVAVAGDTVEMRGGVLFVNDHAVLHSYAPPCKHWGEMERQVVPAGHIFVMGDNRDYSQDSRAWGPVPEQDVIGEPLFVIWSVRSRSSDWLDARGQMQMLFYWTAARHVISFTRWSRTGAWL